MRIASVFAASLLIATLQALTGWSGHGHDKGAQRYSPLTRINTGNVSKLIPVWIFDMKRDGVPFLPSQSVPIVVIGIIYLSWSLNHVAAMEPETGMVIWEFTARSGFSGNLGSVRSLEYWRGDALQRERYAIVAGIEYDDGGAQDFYRRDALE